jgi:CheY-like chemotaxis protein
MIANSMGDLSNINILIIDDSFVNRQYIKAVLEENLIHVIEAGDGAEALDILESHSPHLVILDLMMPVMDGIETLKKIRANGYDFPILILTADIQEATRQKCELLGVTGFIKKPTNAKEIIRLINGAFTGKES